MSENGRWTLELAISMGIIGIINDIDSLDLGVPYFQTHCDTDLLPDSDTARILEDHLGGERHLYNNVAPGMTSLMFNYN